MPEHLILPIDVILEGGISLSRNEFCLLFKFKEKNSRAAGTRDRTEPRGSFGIR